jgi:hypothetical protein
MQTIQHFIPNLGQLLKQIPDFRQQSKVTYPAEVLLFTRILAYLTQLQSVRGITYKFNKDEAIKNIGTLLGCEMKEMFHHDTLTYFLARLSPEEIEELRYKIVYQLIRGRYFDDFRLQGKYWRIAIDGTGVYNFKERHCDKCLTKKLANGEILYYHPVLEAKLIVGDMAISIETEFIENPEPNPSKQDCELKAFVRLAERLKSRFPRLPVCILGDGLYACKHTFEICEKNGWKYILTFKEGSFRELFREYEKVKTLEKGNRLNFETLEVKQDYAWAQDLEHAGHKVEVFECVETNKSTGESTRFVWVTNFHVIKSKVVELGNGGRSRWKIENEGFNDQKNRGYNLEHAYAKDYNAVKNHYLLLQIAHIIGQLCENGSLLRDAIKHLHGSFKNFCEKILEDLRFRWIDPEELRQKLSQKLQIRFSTD